MPRITEITWSLGRTMPLAPLTGRAEDEYANIKPHASIKIAFNADDNTELTKQNEKALREIIESAFTNAANICLEQMRDFGKEFREALAPKKNG